MPKETPTRTSQTNTKENVGLVFKHLPGYARFIREHHLIPYIQEQLRISKELDLPLMKFVRGMSDEDLLTMSVPSHTDFLLAIEGNSLAEHFERSMQRWISDQLGIMKREELTAEDITLAGYVRKKALTKFIPAYTNDVNDAMAIISEIDKFSVYGSTAATNVYINLLKDSISEQTFFTEVLSNTTPGLNYIFDLANRSLKYGNKNTEKFFGRTLSDMQTMGDDIIMQMLHPDDVASTITELGKCARAADEEIVSWELRLKAANGDFIWMRNYSSVYKRNEAGLPTQIVGIILDISEEKNTGEKLMFREKQLLDAQAQAQVGSFDLDVETGKMDVTPQFKEIYELSDFDLNKLIEHVHPDDRDRINANRDTAINDGTLYDNEYRYIINGKEKIIRSRGVTSVKNGRKVLTGTAQDVTEKQLLIERLQQSEELFKQAQARTHIGNWTWDIPANKVTWSDEMYRVYGLEPQSEEVNYETYLAHIHPDDREDRIKQVQRVFETGEPEDHHYRIIRPDGAITILHTKSEIIYDEHGKPLRMTGTCQDVTEKQLLIDRLQRSEELYKQAQAISHIGNWTWNMKTKKLDWSDEVYRIYELEPQSLESSFTLDQYNHPEDDAFVSESIRQAVETKQPFDFNFRIILKSGRIKTVRAKGEVDQAQKGTVIIYGTLQDITEQEAAEQALMIKNVQLQQSNASLEEYAYVASHDLKEPLRKIATFSDRILTSNYESLTDDGKLYFNKIVDASKRMQTMINDLLSVSTILGNTSFSLCNLGTVVTEAMIPLEYKIEESKALIEVEELPVVSVVVPQFRQLFQNLLSNSLKFVRAGVLPHIRISHRFLSPKEADEYKLPKAKKYLQLKVEDNGIGFENEYAGKIFSIFQRLHGKADYDGTGIGLAICKKIVENHGGIIFAKGIVGQGAVFTIILPVAPN